MRLLLPDEVAERLAGALRDAGRREVGGVLMGGRGGARSPTPLFRETGHDYTRYNYLGEWHSHPSFALEPSHRDSESMWRLVKTPRSAPTSPCS